MENASEALKMAATIFIFVLALSTTVVMFSQLNKVSRIILIGADETKYYDYIQTNEKSRIVGLETIIPTLYKYDKEKYTVLFLDTDGSPLKLFETQMNPSHWLGVKKRVDNSVESYPNVVNKYYKNMKNNNTTKTDICAFDLDDETIRTEPWTSKPIDRKHNLDAFLKGENIGYSTSDGIKTYKYNKSGGFINKYKDSKFRETVGEYSYNIDSDTNDKLDNSLNTNKKKRVIIYQLIQS